MSFITIQSFLEEIEMDDASMEADLSTSQPNSTTEPNYNKEHNSTTEPNYNKEHNSTRQHNYNTQPNSITQLNPIEQPNSTKQPNSATQSNSIKNTPELSYFSVEEDQWKLLKKLLLGFFVIYFLYCYLRTFNCITCWHPLIRWMGWFCTKLMEQFKYIHSYPPPV